MIAAAQAFGKELMTPGLDRAGRDTFPTYAARRMRYDVFEAAWDATLYDGEAGDDAKRPGRHPWAKTFKSQNGLAADTQPVLNLAYRLIELHAGTYMAGRLDPKGGDGSETPSCFPIVDPANEAIRARVAKVWRDSNFDVKKPLWLRQGPKLGDAALRIVADPRKGRVTIRSIHPRTIIYATTDDYGHVTSYVLEELRDDPNEAPPAIDRLNQPRKQVRYTEQVTKQGSKVEVRTYRDGKPHPWNGVADAWDLPIPFVPLILTQHIDVGAEWGLSEYSVGIQKGMRADEAGTRLHDALRILTDPTWAIAGLTPKDAEKIIAAQGRGRDAMRIIGLADPAAKLLPFAADFKLAEMSAHVLAALQNHVDDYPEMRFDAVRSRADMSGEAIREARKPADRKLRERRSPYLSDLKRALQMAMTLGALSGFPGFEGITAESYDQGDLDFQVGETDPFPPDALEQLQLRKAEGEAVGAWQRLGVPIRVSLARVGWTSADIAAVMPEIEAHQAAEEAKAQAEAEARGAAQGDDPAETGRNRQPARPTRPEPPAAARE
jgi:hypothetical protein